VIFHIFIAVLTYQSFCLQVKLPIVFFGMKPSFFQWETSALIRTAGGGPGEAGGSTTSTAARAGQLGDAA